MSFASVAAQLYNIKSRKNTSFSTAFGMMVREEVAARTSVFNLVRIATGSTFLATILQAKYGKKTPIEQEEEKERRKLADQDKRFKMFTASSIANLSRRINLAEEITKRNTAMILNLYNDIGYSRVRRRMNPANIKNLNSVRVPLVGKTVVGEIDQLKKQIEQLEKLRTAKPRIRTASEKKKKEETKGDGSLLGSLIPNLLSNPRLLTSLSRVLIPVVAAGVTALGINSGAPKRAIQRLLGKKPTWINPDTGKEEPMPEWLEGVTRDIDPYVNAATGGAAVVAGYGVYGLIKKTKDIIKGVGGKMSVPTATPTTPKVPTGSLSEFAGLNKKQLTRGVIGSRVASTLGISMNQLEKMSVRQIKEALKKSTPSVKAPTSTTATSVATTAETKIPKIAEDILNRTKDITKQIINFQTFSKAILKITKYIAPLKFAQVVFELSKMSSAMADYGDEKITYAEYKNIMSMGYAQIVDAVGIMAVSTAGGAIAGAFVGGLGAIPGAVIGLGAGIAVDIAVDEDDILPIGTLIFETFHENKPPPAQQTGGTSSASRTEQISASTTQTPTSMEGGVGASWKNMPSYSPGLDVQTPSVQRIEGEEGVQAILKTIRKKESNNNYNADVSKDPRWVEKSKKEGISVTASGAYQFIDSTWQGLTRKYKIGYMYQRAVAAPPQIQDQVAAAYVNEILAATGGDVSKVPLAWYTGNIRGELSETAKRLNYGVSASAYQKSWLQIYSGITGTQVEYKPSSASVAPMPAVDGVVSAGTGQAASVAAPPALETSTSSSEENAAMASEVKDAMVTAQAAAIATQKVASVLPALQAGINETRTTALDDEFPTVNDPNFDRFDLFGKIMSRV